jgi:chromosome partitioning protein
MEMMLAGKPFRESIITRAIENPNNIHDFIVIDTPPYVGNLTINGIMACDYLLCPVETEYFALKGFHVFRSALERIQCTVDGIIATKYDSRKNLNNEVLEALKGMTDIWTGIVIRDNVRIAESPYHLKSIYDYAKDSYGAKDYKALVSKIIKTKESWVEQKAM